MKYAVEMTSGVMIYILSFVKINKGVQKLSGAIHVQKRRQGDPISLLVFLSYLSSYEKMKGGL
jgi:hypothetical protein